jgi:hypothetical protein
MNDDLNDDFNLSGLVLIALDVNDGPKGMARALKEYLTGSETILRHGDIDPLFGKITAIALQWNREGRHELVREFLGELVTLLLEHPGFEPISSLTPEKHLIYKFSALGTMLGVMLHVAKVPSTFTDTPRPRTDHVQ